MLESERSRNNLQAGLLYSKKLTMLKGGILSSKNVSATKTDLSQQDSVKPLEWNSMRSLPH